MPVQFIGEAFYPHIHRHIFHAGLMNGMQSTGAVKIGV
jgi:hypothetical protein